MDHRSQSLAYADPSSIHIRHWNTASWGGGLLSVCSGVEDQRISTAMGHKSDGTKVRLTIVCDDHG